MFWTRKPSKFKEWPRPTRRLIVGRLSKVCLFSLVSAGLRRSSIDRLMCSFC